MIDEHLLRFDRKQKYFIFDFETCCLNLASKENVPWEVAWRVATIDKVIEEREFLIKWPTISISDAAAMMTGFWAKQPKLELEGKEPEFVLNLMDRWLYDPDVIPVAHNGLGFDVYIHNILRKRMGKKTDYSYIKRFLDTNVLARGMKLGAPLPKDKKDLISYQYKMYSNPVRGIKTSIKALCGDYGIEYDISRAHSAEYDINLLHQILVKFLWKSEI